ncbi:MAG: hypothetical protein VCA35_04610 [Roseibacillus sp.]
MSGPDPEKVQKMHRYFAVECNNRAWELAELAVRSEEEDHELRINAHAAAYHWAKVGTPVNDMRARILLAEVAAQHGNGELALQLAGQGCAFFENEEGTEWDRAIGTLELAYAHAVSGSKTRWHPCWRRPSPAESNWPRRGIASTLPRATDAL